MSLLPTQNRLKENGCYLYNHSDIPIVLVWRPEKVYQQQNPHPTRDHIPLSIIKILVPDAVLTSAIDEEKQILEFTSKLKKADFGVCQAR